jgi:hypothetical protein
MKVIFAVRDFLLAELRKYEIAGMTVVPRVSLRCVWAPMMSVQKKIQKLKIYLDTNATWR